MLALVKVYYNRKAKTLRITNNRVTGTKWKLSTLSTPLASTRNVEKLQGSKTSKLNK